MRVADLPPPYTDVGNIASHAHPSPSEPMAPTDELQRLRDLVGGVTFNVRLRGLASQDNATAADMHFPRARRAPFSEQAISHLDVVSCWKSLSHSQAVELTIWERLFRQCLATQVEERLQDIIINQISEIREPINEFSLLPCLVGCLPELNQRLIDIDIIKLIREMIETFYEDHSGQTASRNFAWSLGSRDLPSFLYNFLRTQDCFLYTPTGLCLLVDFSSHSYSCPTFTVVADLTWQAPNIRFCNLPEKLPAGEDYCISPQHVDASLEYSSAHSYSVSDHTYYTISESTLDLHYDTNDGCFRGLVPYSTTKVIPSLAETILSAHIVTSFPNNVRFERISRYNIKLDVVQPKHPGTNTTVQYDMGSPHLPTEGHWVPSYTSTPLSKTRRSRSTRERDHVSSQVPLSGCPMSLEDETDEEVSEAFPNKATSTSVLRDTPFPTLAAQPQSSMKRKASQQKGPSPEIVTHISPERPDHRDLGIDAKRQKLVQGEDPSVKTRTFTSADPECSLNQPTLNRIDPHIDPAFDDAPDAYPVNFLTNLMGEAQNSSLPSSEEREDCENCCGCQHRKPPIAKGKAKAKLPFDNWKLADAAHGYSDTDSDNSSVPNMLSPPDTATATDSTHSKQSTELSQEQIQHNYLEFEEQAKRKAAEKTYYATNVLNFDGIVSPTDTVDTEFERVFLEDSEAEGWASEVDGMSEGVESVNMEES